MRIVVLDTETTGLSPESGDRVIEIGCVEMVNRRLTGRTLHRYVNPERTSSEDARKVHGIEDAFLLTQPRFAEVVDELIEFLAGAEVIIHNAPFDVGFLDAELRRIERALFATHVHRVTDTIALAREQFPGKSISLDALCRRLEVDSSARTVHGALLDAGLLAEVYLRMTRGQESLVIDAASAQAAEHAAQPIDFSALELIVVGPGDAEIAAHEAVLAAIDKASGGGTVWRRVEPAGAPA